MEDGRSEAVRGLVDEDNGQKEEMKKPGKAGWLVRASIVSLQALQMRSVKMARSVFFLRVVVSWFWNLWMIW